MQSASSGEAPEGFSPTAGTATGFSLPFSFEDALAVLQEAIELALAMHGRVRVEVKGDNTLVTEADKAVEQLLRQRLGELAPQWSFLGEEGGLTGAADAPCWVIDPIDGTTNYAKNIPLWCISVGAVHAGRPIFGMLAVPETGELLWAAPGLGAWRKHRGATVQLQVRDQLPLEQEDLIAANTTVERVLDFSEVPCRLRNFGALAYHLVALARGSIIAQIAHYHKLYDVAAGLCICLEAGCEVRYLDGTPWTAVVSSASETTPLFCAPPATLADLLSKLKPKVVSEAVSPEQNIEMSD